MIRIQTRAQKAGLSLLTGSVIAIPMLYSTFNQWKKVCELLYARTEPLQCVFFGHGATYFTPIAVITVLFFIIGLILLLLPAIQKRL